MTRSVSAVIGSYESANDLAACIASLEAQTVQLDEIVVVDAGSRDGSVELARSLSARVVQTANRGLSHLYNVGAAAVSSRYVLLANADTAFDAACVGELVRALEADSARWAADPQQLDWDGARVIHARTRLAAGSHRDPIPWVRIDPLVPAADVTRTLAANAGAMLADRERLLALGGFDDTFFIDYEDLDVCWRAWLRGWESVYVPTARLRHRVGASTTGAVRPRRLIASHHNIVRFALKCLPAGVAARLVAAELTRLLAHPRVVGVALARVAGELPEILRLRRELRPSRALYRWMIAGQAGAPPVESR